jgi:uncharacterized membrane protein YuzA (DUF378 family)
MNALYSLSFIVTFLGALLWGLIGIGGFVGKNLNVVSFVSKGNSTIEYGVYIFIGICSVIYVWLSSIK